MLIQEIIRKKRDGLSLTSEEIQFYIEGLSNGTTTKSHIAAFSMAVFFNSMTIEETFHLTDQMIRSGDKLNWLELEGPVIDKHSTGGVGDKVSLMLAPIVASCGIFNPMISGRGLGHTGGTLDKLESIPGYNTAPGNSLFKSVVKNVGCAIIGQTANLAPADKIIYSVRDTTATVESVPLITASILSKKLVAGLDGLVMDIKTGDGAFADQLDFALDIGKTIIQVSKEFSLRTSAIITDMNQPLGISVGNALEVIEVIDYLKGSRRDQRLHQLVLALSTEMLIISGLFDSKEAAMQKVKQNLENGRAAETFEKMISELGGPKNILDNNSSHFVPATVVKPVPSTKSGFINNIKTRSLGLSIMELGGGRKKTSDYIDHTVGISEVLGLGERVEAGDPLAKVNAKNEDDANRAITVIQRAYSIDDSTVQFSPVIIQRMQ